MLNQDGSISILENVEVLMFYFSMTDTKTKEIYLIKMLEIEFIFSTNCPRLTHQCRKMRVCL